MKIRPLGTELFPCGRTDGQKDRQTDVKKLIEPFHNFASAPKKAALKTSSLFIYVYTTSSIHTTKQQIRLLGFQNLDIKICVGKKVVVKRRSCPWA